MRLPPHKAGVYRHYKDHLYNSLGYAHDANADNLWVPDGEGGFRQLGERAVVVYFGLTVQGAQRGPRLAVRTVDDFLAYVDPSDGSPVPEAVVEACQGSVRQVEAQGYVPRFQYQGSQFDGFLDEGVHDV
jgi:hypothetical protein